MPEPYFNLGAVLGRVGRLREALAVWEAFAQRFPSHPQRETVAAWARDVRERLAREEGKPASAAPSPGARRPR